MKKLIKFALIILFNICLVTVVIFSIGKLKEKSDSKKNIELTHADTLFMYENVKYHDDYKSSLYDESFDMGTIFNNGYAPVAKNFKWGFVDKEGNLIIDYKYTEALYFEEDLAPVRIEDKWGFINTKGETIIDFKYDMASMFDPETKLACVQKDNLFGMIDTKGNVVIEFKYDYLNMFSEGLAQAGIDDKYGFIDVNGNVVVDLKYDNVGKFSFGAALVKKGNKVGFIDVTGKEIIPLEYNYAKKFEDNEHTIVRKGKNEKEFLVINKKNEVISKIYCKSAGNIVDGIIPILRDDKYVFVDLYGNPLTEYTYDNFKYFSEGIAAVEVEGKWGFINTKGELVIKCMYDEVGDFTDGIANALFDDRWGFIDKQGNIVVDFKYAVDNVSNFYEGMATILHGAYQCGFMNKDGEVVIGNIIEKEIDYDNLAISNQNFVSISKDGKWGLYDLNGKLKIKHKYNDDLFISEDRIVVEDEETEKYGVIDTEENVIVDYFYDSISTYQNGYAIVEIEKDDEDKHGFIDKNASTI